MISTERSYSDSSETSGVCVLEYNRRMPMVYSTFSISLKDVDDHWMAFG